MFESFRDRDLKDTRSCDVLGAGAPVVQSKGDHSGEFDRRCKTKHTQREGLHPLRIRCGGVGHSTLSLPKPVKTSLNLSSTSSLVRLEDIGTGLDASSIDVSPSIH